MNFFASNPQMNEGQRQDYHDYYSRVYNPMVRRGVGHGAIPGFESAQARSMLDMGGYAPYSNVQRAAQWGGIPGNLPNKAYVGPPEDTVQEGPSMFTPEWLESQEGSEWLQGIMTSMGFKKVWMIRVS